MKKECDVMNVQVEIGNGAVNFLGNMG